MESEPKEEEQLETIFSLSDLRSTDLDHTTTTTAASTSHFLFIYPSEPPPQNKIFFLLGMIMISHG